MKEILKRVIGDFHSGKSPDLFRRESDLPLETGKIITLTGPRRAGKTYRLFQAIDDLLAKGIPRANVLYLNFEDERLDFTEWSGGYDCVLDAWRELYPDLDPGSLWLFFDEIQELPRWEKYVRRLHDTVSRRIFLTGSNSKTLSSEIATALRGRSISFEITPFSFREFVLFRGCDLSERHTSAGRATVRALFEEYLTWGGYPEVAAEDDENLKRKILQEYFNAVVFRDLIERNGIRDALALKRILKRLLASNAKEYSGNKIYNDLKSSGFGLSKDTVFSMLDAAMSVFVFASLPTYSESEAQRQRAPKKVYALDTGFLSAVVASASEDRGKRLETVVHAHLRRIRDEIFFLKNGWECDFLAFGSSAPPLAVQVASRLDAANMERESKGLLKAKERFPECETLMLLEDNGSGIPPFPAAAETADVVEWLLST
jgi:predicted AAA+ superfamily ATPase